MRDLRQAQAEVVRGSMAAAERQKRAEVEMGRLGSGAIAALDATLAAHRDEVVQLEERLRTAEEALASQGRELDTARRRASRP